MAWPSPVTFSGVNGPADVAAAVAAEGLDAPPSDPAPAASVLPAGGTGDTSAADALAGAAAWSRHPASASRPASADAPAALRTEPDPSARATRQGEDFIGTGAEVSAGSAAMSLAPELASSIDRAVDSSADELSALARRIHENPELRFEEHQASAWLGDFVASRGYPVERGVAGMPTAFRARAGKPGGPRVAVLAEYDALPGVGHACGHNLIAAGAVGAFVAAAAVAERVGGEVVLLGTPAEEGGGGKIAMIQAGVFQGVDAAMMFHPFDRDLLAHIALASLWLTFEFRGTPSHAALAPHIGNSALTACMDTFRLVDGQRVHFRDGVRVHGYITDGGQAVNIIPERAACEISVRALDGRELERVRAIVERCARAAALASDVEVKTGVRHGYRDMVNNMALAHRFGDHLAALGRKPRERDSSIGAGSTDMGDVSHVVPSIHPWLAIVDEGAAMCHEHRFAEAAATDRGAKTALEAAKAMARTAIDFLADADLRASVKAEWQGASTR
jgi:amidohydrolase